jgi:hypothetical protein
LLQENEFEDAFDVDAIGDYDAVVDLYVDLYRVDTNVF